MAAADLLVGAACPGCGEPDLAICARCLAAVRPGPVAVEEIECDDDVPVVAGGWYRTELRRIVVDWKEHGRFPLTEVLSHHLAVAVAAVAGSAPRVDLVPVPTAWRARWRRGDDLVRSLADAAAERLAPTGAQVTVRPVLRRTRRTADQAGLTAGLRRGNVAGAFELRRGARPEPHARVVVVDDVVTTGATLAEAARALAAGGWSVAGAATSVATPAPGALVHRGAGD